MAVLAAIWIGTWIFRWWGTVTLEFENKPLGKVLDSFTRQTKLPIYTDLDRTKPTTIRVRRVTVTEALDAIQASTESRGGRLTFLLAPDTMALKRLRTFLPRPNEEAGVVTLEFRIPFPAMAGFDELPEWGDPRNQSWEPSPSLSRQLLPLLEQAAEAAEIRIFLPADWNPPLKTAPPRGKISEALPSLVKIAGGKSEMLYLLPAPRPDGERGRDSPGGGWGGREPTLNRARSLPPEKWIGRLEPRLNLLPPEEQASARGSFEESVRQFKEWETLPQEERRAKFEALMQNPANAEKMGNRFMRGMRNMSPEQRAKRYQAYNSRREAVKDPDHKR